ncbi:MAG: type II toxin-antitoxin system RelE/ParE family toxin [Chitinophagaceae bacterium]|nr:type II toxin-antitoxin system RelE/ParE family toxin [Chitinophagaceae bacterium]
MKFEIQIEDRVLHDFSEAFTYYHLISDFLSTKFEIAFTTAINKLSARPQNHYSIAHNLRRITLDKFPYMLIYTITDEKVIVVALFHQASNPSIWKEI